MFSSSLFPVQRSTLSLPGHVLENDDAVSQVNVDPQAPDLIEYCNPTTGLPQEIWPDTCMYHIEYKNPADLRLWEVPYAASTNRNAYINTGTDKPPAFPAL